MGMYSLIEDERMKAFEAANCWHETPAALALLEKIDTYERCSDQWSELSSVAEAFGNAAQDAECELDDLRNTAVAAAADTYSDNRRSDEWLDAWCDADDDAPPVDQVIQQARRNHLGDNYIERMAA